MSKGRTSRLYRALVRDRQIALTAEGGSFPGNKYPNLFFFFALPAEGHTAQELAGPIHEEIEKLKTQDVTDDELRSVKVRARANPVPGLADTQALALHPSQPQPPTHNSPY